MVREYRRLEINSGQVEPGPPWRLVLNPTRSGYSNSQIDDYGAVKGGAFRWQPGTRMSLRAKFSHNSAELIGTAGFGFWNAPFGDQTISRPALPKAAWFFFASTPTDLPLPAKGPGRGWFSSTIDARSLRAISLAPLTPAILLLNNFRFFRNRIWPKIRRSLKISFKPIVTSMDNWHHYEFLWGKNSCSFLIDGDKVMKTHHSPVGSMGFVAWIDNQYLIATPGGRLGWGVLQTVESQWLLINDLEVASFDSR